MRAHERLSEVLEQAVGKTIGGLEAREMVLLDRIELSTSPLPRECGASKKTAEIREIYHVAFCDVSNSCRLELDNPYNIAFESDIWVFPKVGNSAEFGAFSGRL